jgi:hypothetical protein
MKMILIIGVYTLLTDNLLKINLDNLGLCYYNLRV